MTPKAKARMILAGATQVTEGTGAVLVRLKNAAVFKIADFFGNRAEKIAQRQNDPDGYAADELVEEAAVLLNKLDKRAEKHKAFKPIQVAKATVLAGILEEIAHDQIGRRWSECQGLVHGLRYALGPDRVVGTPEKVPMPEVPICTEAYPAPAGISESNCPRCGAMTPDAPCCVYCGSPLKEAK